MATGDTQQPGGDRDAALQQRREELEAELERYAHAGVASPGLLRVARWVSRGLYVAMAALVVFLLFSGWGKVSQTDYDRAVETANRWKKNAEEAVKQREAAEARAGELLTEAAKLEIARREAEARVQDVTEGVAAADAAAAHARLMTQRAWGEIAYARHWRELLKRAEPHAHGDNPVQSALAMIRQAAAAPAAMRFELLRELADFGMKAVNAAASAGAIDDDHRVRTVSAQVLARLGARQALPLLEKAATEGGPARRELLFCRSLLVLDGEGDVASGFQAPEAEFWLAYALRGYDARQDDLAAHWRQAPAEFRLELLALLCECADDGQADVMTTIARSDRPDGERILAVRWLKARNLAQELLQSIAAGEGPVAEEARP